MNELEKYNYIDQDFYKSVKEVLELARKRVYRNIQNEMVLTYWQIGKMIVEKQGGKERAKYGDGLIKELSIQLTRDFGKGYTERNLEQMRKFYMLYQKPHTLCAKLSWSHYRLIISLDDENAPILFVFFNLGHSARQMVKEITHFYLKETVGKYIKESGGKYLIIIV